MISADTHTPGRPLTLRTLVCRRAVSLFGLHCVFPIGLGGMIYLLWRSSGLYLYSWAGALIGGAQLSAVRHAVAPLRATLPDWFLYSLPDGLWVYACTACMALIWQGTERGVKYLWIATGLILAMGGEVLQHFGAVIGSFDFVDALLCVSGSALACALTSFSGRVTWTSGT